MPASTAYSILLKKENAHDDPIYCCAWTKIKPIGDSKDRPQDFLITGALDGLVKVWTLENNKLDLFHTLEGHSMAVISVAASPDGHTLASTSMDSSLIIWDLLSGVKVHQMQTGPTDVWQVAFSPDGMQVVTGSHTGKLIICSVEKAVKDRILDTRGKFALSVAWSPNGKYISSGSVDGAVCIFDVTQGKLLHTIEGHTQPIRSVDFSPNSQLLVTACNDGSVQLYDVASAGLQATLNHKKWAVRACFSADGTRVATAASDGTVRVASVDGLKLLNTFQEHTNTAWQVKFNAESNGLVSVSKDKSINIYECPVPPKNTVKK